MTYQLFAIIAPIFCCALIGFVWSKLGHPYDNDFVSRMVLNIGAPCLIISTLSKVELNPELLLEVGGVCLLISVLIAVIGTAFIKYRQLDIRTYLPSLIFPNVGNMGLPLCMFAFGEEGLALGLAFFMLLSVAHFSVGVVLVSGGSIWQQLRDAPIIYGIGIAVFLIITDLSLPLWITNTVDLLAGLTIPLMLITLGVSLASLKVASFGTSLLFSVLRIGLGFAVAWLVTEAVGLTGVARGVVLIQSSMPVAVFNYLFAAKYQRSPEQVAGMVVISTGLVFIILPLLLSVALV